MKPVMYSYETGKNEANRSDFYSNVHGNNIEKRNLDIDELRGTQYHNNHKLPFPIVNRQKDHSNVRNNPKTWQKRLNEEFVPEPTYEMYGKSPENDNRRKMEIMTREEYEDLHHFPRARRKYFDFTMQPNRFIFEQDRAQNRDPYFVDDRNNQFGGKSSSHVIDQPRPESLDDARNTLARRAYDQREDGDNAILYSKRVNDHHPPYCDMEYFTKTKQMYIQPDYIRERAQGAINQTAFKRQFVKPRDYNNGSLLKDLQEKNRKMKEKVKGGNNQLRVKRSSQPDILIHNESDGNINVNADNEINTPMKLNNNGFERSPDHKDIKVREMESIDSGPT